MIYLSYRRILFGAHGCYSQTAHCDAPYASFWHGRVRSVSADYATDNGAVSGYIGTKYTGPQFSN